MISFEFSFSRFEVEHVIKYEGCNLVETDPATRAYRFKGNKLYLQWDEDEGIVRYASTSSLVPLGADEDPCRAKTCSAKSFCKVEPDLTAKCVCNPGFEEFFLSQEESTCADIDECARGIAQCSPFADCVNQEGSYGCVCRPGYIGNGQECIGESTDEFHFYIHFKQTCLAEEISCSKLECGDNAECVASPYGVPSCKCVEGYEGDGKTCQLAPSGGVISFIFQYVAICIQLSTLFRLENCGQVIADCPQL